MKNTFVTRMKKYMYSMLERPRIYSLVQKLFRIGGHTLHDRMFREIINNLPPKNTLLDVGCGPKSHLFNYGLKPFGTDLSEEYMVQYCKVAPGFVASVGAMPVLSAAFGGVWTYGLFHHVPDDIASDGIRELTRICKKDGYVVIMDAVLPQQRWKRPVASLIRKLDRGNYMRTQQGVESLLPHKDLWQIRRYTYNALTLVEMLVCVRQFSDLPK